MTILEWWWDFYLRFHDRRKVRRRLARIGKL